MDKKIKLKYFIAIAIIVSGLFLFFVHIVITDKNKVFSKDKLLQLTTQPDTMGQYATDGKNFYWVKPQSVTPYSSSFKIFKGNLKPSIYSTPQAEYIVYSYATDGKNVYYQGSMLPNSNGADPTTFAPIENGEYVHFYGKDAKYVYFKESMIIGADPKTFKILWNVVPEGCEQPTYSKDEKHVFFENKLVEGADPVTFQIIRDDYGKDKNNVFFKDKLQQGVNPVNFEPPQICQYG